MTRPEWVEAGARVYTQGIAAILREVEPLIRADEREQAIAGYANAWDEVSDEAFQKVSDFDRLEAVAARLVEVICEQERELHDDLAWSRIAHLRVELDKARAENATLRAQIAAAQRAEETERNMRLSAEAENATLRAQIAADIEALPTTWTAAWDKGWDSVSLAEVLRIARGES